MAWNRNNVLDRLAIVSNNGMGALSCHPEITLTKTGALSDLDALAARGITMSKTRLFSSNERPGYFGTKRFDGASENKKEESIHMLTAAALPEPDFSQPGLDYHSLMKLTKILTRNSKNDLENMFRRMYFNVFAHNRDDHSKNFSYIYNEAAGQWRLSPAYDLTHSNTCCGSRTIMH